MVIPETLPVCKSSDGPRSLQPDHRHADASPVAQQQLLRVVQQYPRHARISYARNLLGRAYLDDGKPGRRLLH